MILKRRSRFQFQKRRETGLKNSGQFLNRWRVAPWPGRLPADRSGFQQLRYSGRPGGRRPGTEGRRRGRRGGVRRPKPAGKADGGRLSGMVPGAGQASGHEKPNMASKKGGPRRPPPDRTNSDHLLVRVPLVAHTRMNQMRFRGHGCVIGVAFKSTIRFPKGIHLGSIFIDTVI